MSVEHFPDRVTMLVEDKRRIEREHPPRTLYVGEYTVTLNRPCYPCEGTGRQTTSPAVVAFAASVGILAPGESACSSCHGKGRRSTPEGDAIVAHLRDMGLLP